MKHTAHISLGSNHKQEENLREAFAELSLLTQIMKVSPVYESEDINKLSNNAYLNMAVLVATDLSAEELKFNVLRAIEKKLGRNKSTPKIVPIDLDLSLFNDIKLSTEHLSIPATDVSERLYVAQPLADISPNYIHPITNETLQQIAKNLSERDDTLTLRKDIVFAL